MSRPKKVTVAIPGVLVPRPNGKGALMQGGSHPNAGHPRSELRAMMRGAISEWWPTIVTRFPKFSDSDKVRAVDLAARYGLGLQTQQLTPAAIEEQVQALGSVIMEKLADKGFSRDQAEEFMRDVVTETKKRTEQ